MKFIPLFILLLLSTPFLANCQPFGEIEGFSRQDTLRGSITAERAWWDVVHYDLDFRVDIEKKHLQGSNTIYYQVKDAHRIMQIDLQMPMKIDSVIGMEGPLFSERDGAAHFIQIENNQRLGDINSIKIYFSGHPVEAANPPWDGGIAWKKDEKGNPFAASANQGIGSSVWWPCKDHPYDEADSVRISVTVPKELSNVSNGRLQEIKANNDSTRTHIWFVSNPINNYCVNFNIGNYTHFSEKYEGESGTLDMDYYVLKHNLKKAKKQFKQAIPTIEAMEYWFGKYPFYEDGFKLVEAPYLGMEHQSSVTYGNGYKNGYKGTDLSDSGWGFKFDFIIVHETGHEWFANSITNKDVADMWIHESFTAYSESLFLEYHHGKKAASEYVTGTRKLIVNDIPVIGPYGVSQEGSKDMYYKGSNLIHTLRQVINDDELFRNMLRSMNEKFFHQVVNTHQIESFISEFAKIDFSAFFDQYLRDTRIPELEYKISDQEISYRWNNCIDEFDMPVDLMIKGSKTRIFPTKEWKSTEINGSGTSVRIVHDYLIDTKLLSE